MNCPDCGSKSISISHRRGSEKFLKYIYPKSPYRCKECWSRFWVFENPFKTWQTKVIAGSVVCFLLFIILFPIVWSPSKPESTHDTSGTITASKTERGNIRRKSIPPPPALPQEQPASGQTADVPAVTSPQPAAMSDPFTSEDLTPQSPASSGGEPSSSAPQAQTETLTPSVEGKTSQGSEAMPGTAATSSDAAPPAKPATGAAQDKPASVQAEKIPPSAAESASKTAMLTSSGTQDKKTAAPLEAGNLAAATEQKPEAAETVKPALASSKNETAVPAEKKPAAPSSLSPSQGSSVKPETSTAKTEKPLKKRMPHKKPLFSKPKSSKRATVMPPAKFAAPDKKADKKNWLKKVSITPSTAAFNAFLEMKHPQKYSTLTLANPPRTIINIEGEWVKPEQAVYEVQNRFVEQIRIGVHSSFLSIVIDMKTDAQMNVNIVESADGLRISLRP